MNNPIISIIMPIYNAQHTLCRAVDSVISQTFRDWELLLVDDGSNDDSGRVCDEYAQKDARIKALHQPNGGPSSARNYGLANTRGEWIAFLDADDWLEADFLEILYDAVKDKKNVCMVSGGCNYIVDNHVENSSSPTKSVIMSVPVALKQMVAQNAIGWEVWGKLYRRSMINDTCFEESLHIAEDLAFNILFLINAPKDKKIMEIPSHGYNYVCMSETSTYQAALHADNDVRRNHLNLIKKIIDRYAIREPNLPHCLNISRVKKLWWKICSDYRNRRRPKLSDEERIQFFDAGHEIEFLHSLTIRAAILHPYFGYLVWAGVRMYENVAGIWKK